MDVENTVNPCDVGTLGDNEHSSLLTRVSLNPPAMDTMETFSSAVNRSIHLLIIT
jgi:hypothetical protein